jgi:hypothetical protein
MIRNCSLAYTALIARDIWVVKEEECFKVYAERKNLGVLADR